MDEITTMPVETAQEEIGNTMGDDAHPYFHAGHPGHMDAVNRMAKLHERVTGAPDTEATPAESPTDTGTPSGPSEEEVQAFLGSLPPIDGGYNAPLVEDALRSAENLGVHAGVARDIITEAIKYETGKVTTSAKDGMAALVKELGQDGAEEALEKANFIFDQFPVSVQAYLIRTGGANSPTIIKAIAKHGSPNVEARAEADKVINNRESPYWDASHPHHGKTVAQVRKLMKRAYGER